MKRRANGEGTIYKRASGRWVGEVTVLLANGETKPKYVSGKSHKIVSAKMRKLLDEKNRNVPFSENEWTIGEYLDYWMREIHKDIRETTRATYNVMIEKHIKPTMGGHKLKSFTVNNLRSALDLMENDGRSARIRLECVRILSVCLNYAMSEEGGELVSRNVAHVVKRPKYESKETVIWTEEQAALFLETSENHPQYIAFLLFLTYGMRCGEVLGLRYADIDFENGWIYVRQQIGRINGELKPRGLKTKKSRRRLPFDEHGIIRDALIEHARKNCVEMPPFNPNFELSRQGTVVVSKAGTPLEPKSLTQSYKILVKKAGLPCTTIHAMRHMAATFMKDTDAEVKDVQGILGHADPQTTLKFYQHETSEAQLSAVSSVGRRLRRK